MIVNILLVSGTSTSSYWHHRITNLDYHSFNIKTCEPSYLSKVIQEYNAHIFILDRDSIPNLPDYVKMVFDLLRFPQILVVDDNKEINWEDAREAFRAGIIDYIPRSTSNSELVGILLKVYKNASKTIEIM